MSNVPPSVTSLIDEAKDKLNVNTDADSETINRLTALRANINNALSQHAGPDWEDVYPDIFKLCADLTNRIEKISQSLRYKVAYVAQNDAPHRKWRKVKTKSVDHSVAFGDYVVQVYYALHNASMPAVYQKLERLLVFLRDDGSDASAYYPLWEIDGYTLKDLQPIAESLLRQPEKDKWDDFLIVNFSGMRERIWATKAKNAYGTEPGPKY